MSGEKSVASLSKRVLPGVLFGLLVVVVYADPLFFRRNFAGRDLLVYMLPIEKSIHDAYSRGRLPVWISDISGGRPLMANPNTGALYPVRPLLSVLPFPLAMRLFPILHWIAAGIGMIVLLRALGTSAAGAWIGAVTYVFSGVGVSEVFFPNIHPGMALLPWIVWAVQRPGVPAKRKLFVLSLLYGLIFLAGDVFTIGIAIASSVLWISIETARPQRWRELLLLAGALALAALLAAPQIVATALWIPETNRAVLGMKLEESLLFSISPFRLLELLIPFPFGALWQLDKPFVWGWPVFHFKGMGMFMTLYAGAFAVIALISTRKERSSGFRFSRFLMLLSLAVSVSPSLVPKDWGKISSPLPLRNPEKFSVALVFALAIVVGLALDHLRVKGRRPRWPLVTGAVLTVLALTTALAPRPAARAAVMICGADPWVEIASREIPRALAEGAILWTMTFIALDSVFRPSRAARAAALALLTVAPIVANRKIAPTLSELELFSPTRFARLLQRSDPSGSYRTFGESLYSGSAISNEYGWPDDVFSENARRSWTQYVQALWGRGTVFNDDFDVGDLSRVQSIRRIAVMAARYTDSQAFFGSLALRWGIRFRDQKPLAGYRRIGGDALQDWDLLDTAEPDIRLATAWVEERGGLPAVEVLPRLGSGQIVLETGRRFEGRARPGLLHVIRKDPERLVIETVSSEPSWLFVLRGFWQHRTVLLDGRSVECVPAQLAFSAVPVPAGRHRIDWREGVPGGEISRWGPIAYLLFAAALFRSARGKRRP